MFLPVAVCYHACMLRGGLLKARRLSSAGFDKPADRPGFHVSQRDFLQCEFLKIYRGVLLFHCRKTQLMTSASAASSMGA